LNEIIFFLENMFEVLHAVLWIEVAKQKHFRSPIRSTLPL